MNPYVRIFLEHMLTRNLALVLFMGLLLPILSGGTVKQSFTSGRKLATGILFAMLAAALWSAFLPEGWNTIYMAGVLLIAVWTIRAMGATGVFSGEWAGIPCAVFAYVPVIGSLLMLRASGLTRLDAVVAAFGTASGYYLAVILITALIEQIRISEAAPPYRRVGALLMALAMMALALAGFRFY